MPEPLRSFSRTRWARWSGWLAGVALLCLGTARVPLEDAPRVEALAREAGDRIGAEVRFGAVRVDPLGAGGVVVTDLRVDGGAWRLVVPRAVWRPGVGGLLRAEARGVLRANAFALEIDGDLARLVIPDLDVRLVGGRVDLAGRGPILVGARLTTGGSGADRRFELEGVQPGGGRLDLRVRRDADGRMVADAFPEAFALAGIPLPAVRRALAEGLPGLEVDGHWRMGVEPEGQRDHEFDLALRTASGRRTELRALGALSTRPGDEEAGFSEGADFSEFAPGSWIEVSGRLGHGTPNVQVSGPVSAQLLLDGRVTDPRLRLILRLDDAHLRVADGLRKPTGLRARLRYDHEPEAGRTRIGLELGALRARATRVGEGPFEGESGWVDLADLVPWLPGLAPDAGGRVRMVAFRYGGPEDYAVRVALDGARTAGAGVPVAASGVVDFGPEGFSATGLTAELAGTPLRLDLAGRRGADDAPLELVARARLETLGFATAADPDSGTRDPEGGAVDALVAAAEAPVLRLHEERTRFAGVAMRSGHVEVGRLRVGNQVVEDLEIDLTLRALRLDVSRVAFRGEAGPERYSGSVDFNPLLPVVEFAATP